MTKTRKTNKIRLAPCAVALAVLLGASFSVDPAAAGPGASHLQVATQQFKAQPRGTGPVRPTAPRHLAVKRGNPANGSYGCHDHASMTSYEGPCDYYPEYEATGGCESEATQTSYPGNCQNSSEP